MGMDGQQGTGVAEEITQHLALSLHVLPTCQSSLAVGVRARQRLQPRVEMIREGLSQHSKPTNLLLSAAFRQRSGCTNIRVRTSVDLCAFKTNTAICHPRHTLYPATHGRKLQMDCARLDERNPRDAPKQSAHPAILPFHRWANEQREVHLHRMDQLSHSFGMLMKLGVQRRGVSGHPGVRSPKQHLVHLPDGVLCLAQFLRPRKVSALCNHPAHTARMRDILGLTTLARKYE